MKKVLSIYWKSTTIILLICYLSLSKGDEFPKLQPFEYFDKIVHFIMYFTLSAVLVYDYKSVKNPKAPIYAYYLLALVFPAFFGGIIEILQGAFFPPRTADWLDWLADIAGTFFGFFVVHLFFRKKSK